MVVVSHSWQLGGYGPQPQVGGVALGTWSVCGFFVISGYLITRSRLSGRPAIEFYWARFLRIFPAFIVCLLVIAFVAAPLSTAIGPGQYSLVDAIGYVYHNLFLYPPVYGQQSIGDTLNTVPFANNWDGPLWTLFYEAACYVFIGIFVSVIRRRYLATSLTISFIVVTIAASAFYSRSLAVNELVVIAAPLLVAFLAGGVVYLCGNHINAGPVMVVLAIAALALATASGFAVTLAPLPLAFLIVKLGNVLPLQKVGSRYDISYGIYIYGCVVQQLLALIFPGGAISVWAFVSLSILITVPLAFLSSALIEKPALTLKTRVPQLREPAAAPA
ncbi:acyltransferase [Cryobacterium sp. PAMC25264]|nr:acyltransferase [Cryobacterium sp. PAMC25264]